VSGPWQLTDTVRRAQGYLVAAVALTVSWYGTASTTALSRQVVFVATGIAAVGVVGTAECMWLLGGLRSVRDRRCALQQGLSSLRAPTAAVTTAALGPVTVPGGSLVHNPGCPVVEGKKQTRARRAGLRPCPLCHLP
jgi:hypothetical protein